MKKIITSLMILVMIFLLTACTNKTSDKTNNDGTGGKISVNNETNSKFNENEVKKQLEVKTYSYNNDYWNYGFVEIKNNSEYDLTITVNVKFYDASGNLIGADDSTQYAFQQGTKTLFYFDPDEEFTSIEYSCSVKEEENYECAVKDLSYESVTAKDKEIISVTNNGTEIAEDVEGYILFFNGDKVVDFEWEYFTDDDYELKPEATITKEMECDAKYDSYEFYLTGRR